MVGGWDSRDHAVRSHSLPSAPPRPTRSRQATALQDSGLVEVAQPGEVAGAEGDQVGERWLISHVDTVPAWAGNAPIVGGVASLCSSLAGSC